jgi:hypothetical protein
LVPDGSLAAGEEMYHFFAVLILVISILIEAVRRLIAGRRLMAGG